MKNVFSLAFALFVTCSVSAQSDAIERFFKDYQENKDFTVVYVAPKMFQMVSKITTEAEDKELASIVKDLKGLRILTSKVNPSVGVTSVGPPLVLTSGSAVVTTSGSTHAKTDVTSTDARANEAMDNQRRLKRIAMSSGP